MEEELIWERDYVKESICNMYIYFMKEIARGKIGMSYVYLYYVCAYTGGRLWRGKERTRARANIILMIYVYECEKNEKYRAMSFPVKEIMK